MGLYDGVSRIFDRKLYRLTRRLTVYQPLERQIVFRSLMLSSSLLRWIRHGIVVRPFQDFTSGPLIIYDGPVDYPNVKILREILDDSGK